MSGREGATIPAIDLTKTLLSYADVDGLLDTVARTVCESTGFERSLILDVDNTTGRVRGRAGFGIPADTVSAVHGPGSEFPILAVLGGREDALVARPNELRRLVPAEYLKLFDVRGAVVAQPMRSDRLGLLGVVFCDSGTARAAVDRRDIQTVGELSSIAAVAFQHVLLVRRSVALQSLRERARIAAELHDGVTQQLYAANLDVDELRSNLTGPAAEDPALGRLAERLETALEQLRAALVEIARGEVPTSGSPRRRAGEGGDVVGRMRGLLDELGEIDGPTGDFDVSGSGTEPVGPCADLLVRVVREGLANVTKHASATQVEVSVRRGAQWWTVELDDDGGGRAEEIQPVLTKGSGPSFGLRSLSEEAARLGGRLWVERAPRLLGLRLGVEVPVDAGRKQQPPPRWGEPQTPQ
ncbi:ATP-binding protein [Pseudonocardia sp. WMMC193]|uniref:sensor histidine kinase n=1 Tax=Pseudonocardia sp. WMMC193 TaxID=2911965 RepID=UPI001F00C028|nr:histidine kinase [Pseudonocardia sp. WMMC193]MCF7550734.1 histidine kinase [Pseudonocardia sp. WMMC193]